MKLSLQRDAEKEATKVVLEFSGQKTYTSVHVVITCWQGNAKTQSTRDMHDGS